MTAPGLLALLPLIVLSITIVIVMLVAAFFRSHTPAAVLSVLGLAGAFIASILVTRGTPQHVTQLLIVDRYALFFTALICAASLAVALLAYDYLDVRRSRPEEFYLLLLLATLGSAVLAASSHFASFFLGLEVLSVALYAMIAYERTSRIGVEAGLKYLVLAATSAAMLLFGMALVYAAAGTMELSGIADAYARGRLAGIVWPAGLALVIVGIGFKLAVVPFHLWTPDVYQGAPAPVTAFIATVSKGAMFALLLRYVQQLQAGLDGPIFVMLVLIAVASMFAGNLLALLQTSVKRILAYSSIAHLGYLLVALLAGGQQAVVAVSYYLVAYFVTTLGAFGIVTLLSGDTSDADSLDDYRGLAWRRPWLAGVFTAMLFSLAGIPLTAGFIGKFVILAAGVGSRLWLLVVLLVINSAIGLFYYLRVVVALYGATAPSGPSAASAMPLAHSPSGNAALAVLLALLVWLGIYPGTILMIVQGMVPTWG